MIVELIGPPAAGKSTLSYHLAATLQPEYVVIQPSYEIARLPAWKRRFIKTFALIHFSLFHPFITTKLFISVLKTDQTSFFTALAAFYQSETAGAVSIVVSP